MTKTRAPLNAIDDDDNRGARPAVRKAPPSSAASAPPATEAASRTTRFRQANGIKQFNVELPEETYLMLASLKLTEQVRTRRRVTLQMLVTQAVEDFIARERAKHLHND